ncbi:MAG: DNA-processing protein DprA [Bacillota bacterium]
MDINQFSVIFLNDLNGFGPKTIANLIKKFDDLNKLWYLKTKTLKNLGLSSDQIKIFNKNKDKFRPKKIKKELKNKNIKFLTLYNDNYPKKLRMIYDPPPVIFYQGETNFQLPAVAIIGSRNSTVYGRKIAFSTASKLAKLGINIISGLANGIDSTAHKGALAVELGITTAILGNGFDFLYPSQNRLLAQKITENGLMITEFNPNKPPKAKHFPRRNRIISALADLILVIEAGAKSGTLITVDYALEQGKEVMAVPGNIDRPNSIGANRLLKKGAAVFTQVSDIKDYLSAYLQQKQDKNDFVINSQKLNTIYPKLNAAEIKVLKLFQHEVEIYYDDLLKLSNLTETILDQILVKFELMELIIRLRGKKYQFKGLQKLIQPI